MLPRENRLQKDEYRAIFPKMKRISGSFFVLKFAQREEGFKAAVGVSKKVLKKAHDRNRARRRVYSMLHNLLPSLLPINLVIQVQKDIREISHTELKDGLSASLKEANLLKN